jgi:hypothetical protein
MAQILKFISIQMELIIRTFDYNFNIHLVFQEIINKCSLPHCRIKEWRISGYGEATSNPYYNITVDILINDLEKTRPNWKEMANQYLEELHPYLKRQFIRLMCFGCSLHWFIRTEAKAKIVSNVNYLIIIPWRIILLELILSKKMVQKMVKKPWPIYKIN